MAHSTAISFGADVDGTLSARADLPYAFCVPGAGGSHVAYRRAVLERAKSAGDWMRVRTSAGAAAELIHLQSEPWDSQMFGMNVARIAHWLRRPGECDAELLDDAIEAARASGVRYLWLRIPASDLDGARMLGARGFEMIDGLITFGAAVDRVATTVTTDGSRTHRESDIPAVIEIAGRSFRFGRFHDPVLPQGTAECAYRTWAENACRGKVADCVLVAGTGAVAGFTTIKFDPIAESTLRAKVATIGLVATSAQERGKGIARSLALAALEWCRQQDCKWIEVGTQMGNIAACRLYESAGYRVVSSTLTYRKLL